MTGVGSPGNLTEQHFSALEKSEGKAVADKARAAAGIHVDQPKRNEMLSLAPSTVIPSPRDIQTIVSLVELLADPKATRARLDDFSKASAAAQKLLDDAAAAQAKLAADRLATEHRLADERAKHDDQLSREREAHRAEIGRINAEIAATQKRTAELNAQARADATKAAELKADMMRRIRLVTDAA
ncbi:MAG TPA: hypothetical protein VL048_03695 [Xanthobacteraceae bacterium]|nr:hypothetical protein [Xanthobacteraceae bacterium]